MGFTDTLRAAITGTLIGQPPASITGARVAALESTIADLIDTVEAQAAQVAPAAPAFVPNSQFFPADAGFIEVKATFGAKGDGVTDDTAAIISAIHAACTTVAAAGPNGGLSATLLFRGGTFLISAPLKSLMPDGTTWHSWLTYQGSGQTTIKLQDYCPGYQAWNVGFPQFSTIAYMIVMASEPGSGSNGTTGAGNDAFGNYINDLVLDVGAGNPAAVGVNWMGSNFSGIENLHVIASDPGKRGVAGISDGGRGAPGPTLFKNIVVDGFVSSLSFSQQLYGLTFTGCGLYNPIDQTFSETGNGAYVFENLTAPGFQTSIGSACCFVLADIPNPHVTIPATPTPILPFSASPNPSDYIKPTGLDPTGATDNTAAIQAAIDSGKPVVYLGLGTLLISDTIHLRGNCRRLWGCGAQLVVNPATWGGGSPKPMISFDGALDCQMDQMILGRFGDSTASQIICVQHNSPATLVMKHILQGPAAFRTYRNTALGTGNCFMEDVVGNCNDIGYEIAFPQNVWARQLNPEIGGVQGTAMIKNNGGQLRILGLKSEGRGTVIWTTAGRTEVVGGLLYPLAQDATNPAFLHTGTGTGSYSFATASFTNSPAADYVTLLQTPTKTVLKSQVPPLGFGALVLPGNLYG